VSPGAAYKCEGREFHWNIPEEQQKLIVARLKAGCLTRPDVAKYWLFEHSIFDTNKVNHHLPIVGPPNPSDLHKIANKPNQDTALRPLLLSPTIRPQRTIRWKLDLSATYTPPTLVHVFFIN
jgi:hypothetical protein